MLRFFCFLIALSWAPVMALDPSILVLGDSLSSAYGMDLNKGWVSLLQRRLESEGYPHRVVNASIAGDTTASGLTRLQPLLERHRPAIVVLELGGNDGLRTVPVGDVRRNLAHIVESSRAAGSRVLLLGIRLPPNYGAPYIEPFEAIYPALAHSHSVSLVPFLLDGVAVQAGMMQADGVHPNAAAQERILDNVWPGLEALIGSTTTGS